MSQELTYLSSGDHAIIIHVKDEISEKVHHQIRRLSYVLETCRFTEITDIVLSYGSILVHYDPLRISFSDLVAKLKVEFNKMSDLELPPMEIVHIPVCYDREFGIDLSFVAQHNGLDHEAVIELHSREAYLVHMIGFLPGFPYLGGMSDKINTPRLNTPRMKIPAGSVGIAGGQTGVYPIDSPGGWRIIGRTPVKLFDMDKSEPALLRASQYIKFDPISKEEFMQIENQVSSGSYELKVTHVE